VHVPTETVALEIQSASPADLRGCSNGVCCRHHRMILFLTVRLVALANVSGNVRADSSSEVSVRATPTPSPSRGNMARIKAIKQVCRAQPNQQSVELRVVQWLMLAGPKI